MSGKFKGSRGGGRGGLGEPFEVSRFIEGVARGFEARYGASVSGSARQALIRPALGHEPRLEAKLDAGQVTIEMLEGYIVTLLQHAGSIAEAAGHSEIDGAAVEEAMRLHCPYFPWC